jgi:DNA-directed RNA polymerase specialized sigma24 family protein
MSTQQLEDEWLTDLFGRHSRAVLAYARRRLDSAEDAEDVVVEVFATAWRRRDVVPDEALPWLYATAGNVIAHVIRSDSRRTRLGTKLATVRPLHTTEVDPAQQVVDGTTARTRMHRARARLREALVQRGVSGPGVDGPGTQPPPGETTPPHDTLTTPNGSEATR